MKHGVGNQSFFNQSFFDGTKYLYQKIRMSVQLQNIGLQIWKICVHNIYEVWYVRVTPLQVETYDADNKARNVCSHVSHSMNSIKLDTLVRIMRSRLTQRNSMRVTIMSKSESLKSIVESTRTLYSWLKKPLIP